MTKEQKLYKSLIKADLKIALSHYSEEDKVLHLQAAYHMQQAIEKTIKLKAEIAGFWSFLPGEFKKSFKGLIVLNDASKMIDTCQHNV